MILCFLNWAVDIRYLFKLLLTSKYIYVNSLHYIYDAFNNENKFNERIDKSWYDMMCWKLQSAKIEKIKYFKFNNQMKCNFSVKRQKTF